MNIDPGSDVPLFVQIAEGIEEDIFTGSYAEGDRIPSTNELSALLGINPHTVLKGMNILVDEGIIYKRRGMGMYVQTGAGEKVRAKRRNAFDERFVQALGRRGEEARPDETAGRRPGGERIRPCVRYASTMCRSRSARRRRSTTCRCPSSTGRSMRCSDATGRESRRCSASSRTACSHERRIFVDGEPAADNARALAKLYCMNDKKMYPENLAPRQPVQGDGALLRGIRPDGRCGLCRGVRAGPAQEDRIAVHGYRSIYQLVVGLSLDVDYLLLDEPVLGLDANHRELFYKLLLDDYLEKQRTVIIATHLIEEVANLVEQVTIVDRGRVLLASSAEELRASGYSVSGRTADVAAYCAGMEVLDVEELGGLSVAYVQGKPDAARLNERLDVAPLNLQKLFVKLTEKEEAR